MEKGSETTIDWDIRFFRRYPKATDFELTILGRKFPARTIDYSVIGVGAVMEYVSVPLIQGDVVSLDIDELDLHEQGRVAWIQKTPSNLRIGILRVRPLKGSFRLYPLSDILIGLQRTLKTGILDVRLGSINKKVYVRAGNVICAASNYDKDRLGDVLLKCRKIDRRQYDEAAEIKRTSGGRYSAILVSLGYLKPQDIIRAAELQTRRIIASLFAMKDAEFEFIEGPLPSRDAVTLNLSVSDLIYRVLKRNADVDLLKNYLLDSTVDFSSNPLNLFQNIRFTAADKAVISCVDGKTAIRDIIKRSASGRIDPLKIIYALLEARFLKIRESHESPSGISAGEVFGPGAKGSSPAGAQIDRLYSEYKNLDYYRILDLDRQSTTDEAKKAYYRMARKYHPDMHIHLPEATKRKLIEIFSYVTTACLTLTDPSKRKEYDRVLSDSAEREDSVPGSGPSIIREEAQKEAPVEQPESTGLSGNQDSARNRFRDGKVAFWDRNYDVAARLFAMAISYDGSAPEYYFHYGVTLGMLGRLKEAVQALNRANELKPMDSDTLAELGHVYLKLGFPVRAGVYFDKAVTLDPSNGRVAEGRKLMRER